MPYQETGRFGRITKHLRKGGFEDDMEHILHDSAGFPNLSKPAQGKYVAEVVDRMVERIGKSNAEGVLFECGAQCCGKSWASFARRIWDDSSSMDEFIVNLNREEEKYDTRMTYLAEEQVIVVERSQCICGLIKRGLPFEPGHSFCTCSIGHMSVFFNAVLDVESIDLEQSIATGADCCKWRIKVSGGIK